MFWLHRERFVGSWRRSIDRARRRPARAWGMFRDRRAGKAAETIEAAVA
jgi:hypothetical protein